MGAHLGIYTFWKECAVATSPKEEAEKTIADLEKEFGIESPADAEPTEPAAGPEDLGFDEEPEVEDAAPEPAPKPKPAAAPKIDKDAPEYHTGGLFGKMALDIVPIQKLKAGQGFRKVETKDKDFVALVSSIKQHGLLNPLTVQDGIVIGGRRRLEACKAAGLKDVPVVEVSAEDEHTVALAAFLDNMHRKQLTPLEEAHGMKALIKNKVVENQSALAEVLGVTPATITRTMSMLELPDTLKKALTEEKISASAAYELRSADKATIQKVLKAAKPGKPATKQTSREAVKRTSVMVSLPEGTPDEIKSATVNAKGVRLVLDLAHPGKVYKGGTIAKILADLAKDCSKDVDSALTIARKEVDDD